jgi:shikimate dehydrogenase
VLLLGAGGAASAVLAALEEMGVGEIAIANRGVQRARALAERYARPGLSLSTAARAEELAGSPWDLVVNATSLGLRPGERPPVVGVELAAALDLVYAPGGTAWVRDLRAGGVPAADGTEMLLRQGAAAFRRWFGVEPELAAMRRSLGAETPTTAFE